MEIDQIFLENGYLYVLADNKIIRKYIKETGYDWEEVSLPTKEVKPPEQINKGDFNDRIQS